MPAATKSRVALRQWQVGGEGFRQPAPPPPGRAPPAAPQATLDLLRQIADAGEDLGQPSRRGEPVAHGARSRGPHAPARAARARADMSGADPSVSRSRSRRSRPPDETARATASCRRRIAATSVSGPDRRSASSRPPARCQRAVDDGGERAGALARERARQLEIRPRGGVDHEDARAVLPRRRAQGRSRADLRALHVEEHGPDGGRSRS